MKLFLASLLLMTASAGQAADSLWGIQVRPDKSTVDPLPVTAEEASRRFGDLPAWRSDAAKAMLQRIADSLGDQSLKTELPPLFMSKADIALDYRATDLVKLRKRLNGGYLAANEPMRMESTDEEDYAVTLAKVEGKSASAAAADLVAIVFVFHDDKIDRVVFAFLPWVKLAAANG